MSTEYAVLGAGAQGVAAAYDIAKHGRASRILLADLSRNQAARAAAKVNRLVDRDIVEPVTLDASDSAALTAFLSPLDVALCCLPYQLQPTAIRAAIAARTHLCDLDGEDMTEADRSALDAAAWGAGITLIPDAGLAPGLVNTLGLHIIGQLDTVESIKLYCGVLPQEPRPPFNYKLGFHIDGLIAEYDEPAIALRDGQVVTLQPLTEREEIEFDGITLEAFVTGGGTSSAPSTFQGRVANYEYKTLRYPGHCDQMRVLRDLGMWRTDTIQVDGAAIRPRDVFISLFAENQTDESADECFVRGVGIGTRDGKRVQIQVDIRDRECEETEFTSMQRLTGFSLAIHAIALAENNLPTGALRYENALPAAQFLSEIRKRGVEVKETETVLAD
jgi:lysine 6-dehydrogenase